MHHKSNINRESNPIDIPIVYKNGLAFLQTDYQAEVKLPDTNKSSSIIYNYFFRERKNWWLYLLNFNLASNFETSLKRETLKTFS